MDIRSMDLSGFLHIPDRRDGESHANRVVYDIVSALTYLDEQRNLLPNYVAESPDNMPTTRLYDGDMLVLFKKYEKMEKLMADFDSRLTAMFNEVKATGVALGSVLGAKSNSVGGSSQPPPPQPSTSRAQQARSTAVTSEVNNGNGIQLQSKDAISARLGDHGYFFSV